ncbi:MAG: RsfS/YbeB/iojap family protein [Arsenophonus sp. NC-WZS1-MAG3]
MIYYCSACLVDIKTQDIVTIGLRRKPRISDCMIICNETSNCYLTSVSDKLIEAYCKIGIIPFIIKNKDVF